MRSLSLGLGLYSRGGAAASAVPTQASYSPMVMQDADASDLLYGTGAITLFAWVKPSTISGTQNIFWSGLKHQASDLAGIDLRINSSGNVVLGGRSFYTDSYQSWTSTHTVSADTWTPVAAVFDYVNGETRIYVGSSSNVTENTGITFNVSSYAPSSDYDVSDDVIGANGQNISTPSSVFSGSMFDFAAWTAELTTTQLDTLMAGGRPGDLSFGATIWVPMTTEVDGTFPGAKGLYGGIRALPLSGYTRSQADLPDTFSDWAWTPETRFDGLRILKIQPGEASTSTPGAEVTSVDVKGLGRPAFKHGVSTGPDYQEVGGAPVLRFNGAESLALRVGRINPRDGMTFVFLGDPDNTGRVFSYSEDGTNEANAVFASFNAGGVRGDDTNISFSSYGAPSLQDHVCSMRFNGEHLTSWLDGVRRNGTPSGASEFSNGTLHTLSNLPLDAVRTDLLNFGRRNQTGSELPYDGDIFGAFVVFGHPTDREIQYLEAVLCYEAGKESILDSSHDWSSSQPAAATSLPYLFGTSTEVAARSKRPWETYLGSPSIMRASDGTEYFSHDVFSNAGITSSGDTTVYARKSSNKRWHLISNIINFRFGTLWQHTDGNLYSFGTSSDENRQLQICKSTDSGQTWAKTTLSTGTLIAAAFGNTTYGMGAGKPLFKDGYIFLGFNSFNKMNATTLFGESTCYIMYADVNDDLTVEANWNVTTGLKLGTNSIGNSTNPSGTTVGMNEHNIIEDDAGDIYAVFRVISGNTPNQAPIVPVTWDGTTASWPAWSSSYVRAFPGGACRFTLNKSGGTFYSIVNDNTAVAEAVGSGHDNDQRNQVAWSSGSSADLSATTFSLGTILVDEADVRGKSGFSESESIQYEGLQYTDWFLNGSTAVAATRVALNGSNDDHDSNFMWTWETSLPT